MLELHKFELDLFSRAWKEDVACGKLVLCYLCVISIVNSVVQ